MQSNIDAKVARVIMSRRAAFDPLLSSIDGYACLRGIHIRRAQDDLLLELFPQGGNRLLTRPRSGGSSETDSAIPQVEMKRIVLQGNMVLEVEGLSIDVRDNAGDKQALFLPTIHPPYVDQHLIWSVDCHSSDSKDLLQIPILTPYMRWLPSLTTSGSSREIPLTDDKIKISLQIFDGFSVVARGDTLGYSILFQVIEATDNKIDLWVSYRGGKLTLSVADDQFSAAFWVAYEILPGQKLLGGRRSSSIRISRVALASVPPTSPRLILSAASALYAPDDIPITLSPIAAPQFAFVPILITANGTDFFPDPSECNGIVFLGCPEPKVLSLLCRQYRVIAVIASNKRELACALALDSETKGPIFITKGEAVLAGIVANEPFSKTSAEAVDRFIQSIHELSRPETMSQTLVEHFRGLLPRLPMSIDLAVAATLLVINRFRGRAATDDGSDTLTYEDLFDDQLWLTPWSGASTERSELLLELNLHLASEFLAVQIASELSAELNNSALLVISSRGSSLTLFDAYVSAWEKNSQIR